MEMQLFLSVFDHRNSSHWHASLQSAWIACWWVCLCVVVFLMVVTGRGPGRVTSNVRVCVLISLGCMGGRITFTHACCLSYTQIHLFLSNHIGIDLSVSLPDFLLCKWVLPLNWLWNWLLGSTIMTSTFLKMIFFACACVSCCFTNKCADLCVYARAYVSVCYLKACAVLIDLKWPETSSKFTHYVRCQDKFSSYSVWVIFFHFSL